MAGEPTDEQQNARDVFAGGRDPQTFRVERRLPYRSRDIGATKPLTEVRRQLREHLGRRAE